MKKNILIVFLVFTFNSITSCQTKFDKEIWLKNDDFLKIKNPRANMVNDLMHNYLKAGMKKKEVVKLLGNPYRDTIGLILPKGFKPPDSLHMNTILRKKPNKREKYISFLNDWYKKNYQSTPMITYPIGWSMIDPIFLEIQLNNKNEVVDFWTKEH